MRFINTNDSRDQYEIKATPKLRKAAAKAEAWVSLQEFEMDTFMVTVLPKILKMHYSDKSVHLVEEWLLKKAPTMEALKSSEDAKQAYFYAIRYFAEVLCNRFEAEWIMASTDKGLIDDKPQIMLPFGVALSLFSSIDYMINSNGEGSFADDTFSLVEPRYTQWIAEGRPQKVTPLGGKRPLLAPMPKAVLSLLKFKSKSK